MLPHRVGRSLKPAGALHRLFGGKHFDVSAIEWIESIAVGDVPVQRRGIELRQNEDPLQSGVDAVADRNIDQAILSSEWNRRFGAVLRQREQAFPSATCKNDGDNV